MFKLFLVFSQSECRLYKICRLSTLALCTSALFVHCPALSPVCRGRSDDTTLLIFPSQTSNEDSTLVGNLVREATAGSHSTPIMTSGFRDKRFQFQYSKISGQYVCQRR